MSIPYSRGAVFDKDQGKLARLQAIFTRLLEHQLTESLESVEERLRKWRQGEMGPFEAHAELVRYATRAERMIGRVAHANEDAVGTVLRDAYDAGFIEREEFVDLVGAEPETIPPSPVLEDETSSPDKRKLVEEMLEEGPVLLHINAATGGVDVPMKYRDDPRLVLRFGYGLSPPIVDLNVDEDGISGTLTFEGRPYHCTIPWCGMYAAVLESRKQGMVWPEDVPEEVLEDLSTARLGEDDTPAPSATAESRPTSRPHTSSGSSTGDQSVGGKPQGTQKKRRRATHLKLVE